MHDWNSISTEYIIYGNVMIFFWEKGNDPEYNRINTIFIIKN